MYRAFYGLAGRPFGIAPDPAFHFPSAGHRAALGCLAHGLRRGEGPVLLTGEAGTGKTLLAALLAARLGTARVLVLSGRAARGGEAGVMAAVAAGLGLDPGAGAAAGLLRALRRGGRGRAAGGGRLLLVVDEAQALEEGALEGLGRLAAPSAAGYRPVRLLLLGRPELAARLARAGSARLAEPLAARHRLAPLAAEELRAYVEHRLARVGWRQDPRLGPDCLEVIHAATGGVPRRVNLLCARLLVVGALEQRHELGAAEARAVAAELGDAAEEPEGAAAAGPEPWARAFARLRRRLEGARVELARERRRRAAAETELERLREELRRLERGRRRLEAEAGRRLADLALLMAAGRAPRGGQGERPRA
jgi:type II secretory pathway predicted ATPase ExeA